jgi:excisionase family DNA binding protein
MNMDIEELLTIPEVEEKLKVNGSTVRRWIQQGKIRAFKFGRTYRIPKDEFEKFVKQSLVHTDNTQREKRRFSMQGMFKGGEPITEEAIEEVIKEWERE